MSSVWNGEKHVWQAAAEGDIQALQAFLSDGVNVNAADGNEDLTPLICAATSGQRQAVAYLLDNGADVNKGDISGTTPLMSAAACGHVETVKLLLERGADVTLELGVIGGNAGATALDLAARNGHFDVVAVLEKAAAR